MFVHHDPDEWEIKTTIHERGPYGGSGSIGYVRRPAADVARIKAERRQREEDEILRKADAIRARRSAEAT
jgi:hypothetical protein